MARRPRLPPNLETSRRCSVAPFNGSGSRSAPGKIRHPESTLQMTATLGFYGSTCAIGSCPGQRRGLDSIGVQARPRSRREAISQRPIQIVKPEMRLTGWTRRSAREIASACARRERACEKKLFRRGGGAVVLRVVGANDQPFAGDGGVERQLELLGPRIEQPIFRIDHFPTLGVERVLDLLNG